MHISSKQTLQSQGCGVFLIDSLHLGYLVAIILDMEIKKKQFDVIAVGGATRDIMFYTKDGELVTTKSLTREKLLGFEYGAKILADKLYFSFGGGAANAAATLSSFGLRTGIICRIGEDEIGKAVLKNFNDRKIDTSLIRIDKKNDTGFSVVVTLNNLVREHIVFAHRGANSLLNSLDLQLDNVDTDWFYISSLPKDGWENIMKKIIRYKKNIAWNPGGRQLHELAEVKKFLPFIKVFMLNRDEALEFKKLKDIKGLIKYIQGLGPDIVVITDGSKGAYVYDGNKYYFMAAKKVKSVDTVGVGDAFAGAFTSALICGKNIKTSLEWGIKNSASVVTKIGAQNGILSQKQVSKV